MVFKNAKVFDMDDRTNFMNEGKWMHISDHVLAMSWTPSNAAFTSSPKESLKLVTLMATHHPREFSHRASWDLSGNLPASKHANMDT